MKIFHNLAVKTFFVKACHFGDTTLSLMTNRIMIFLTKRFYLSIDMLSVVMLSEVLLIVNYAECHLY